MPQNPLSDLAKSLLPKPPQASGPLKLPEEVPDQNLGADAIDLLGGAFGIGKEGPLGMTPRNTGALLASILPFTPKMGIARGITESKAPSSILESSKASPNALNAILKKLEWLGFDHPSEARGAIIQDPEWVKSWGVEDYGSPEDIAGVNSWRERTIGKNQLEYGQDLPPTPWQYLRQHIQETVDTQKKVPQVKKPSLQLVVPPKGPIK